MSYTSFELANWRRMLREKPSEQDMRLIESTNELFNLWLAPPRKDTAESAQDRSAENPQNSKTVKL